MDKGKILIVDDDLEVCQVLTKMLARHDYASVAANDRDRALTLLQAGSFDLAIADLVLPGRDGLQLIRDARQLDPEIEIIILTGYGNLDNAIEALRLGAFDYFLKPIQDPQLFLHSIERALERQRLRRANRDLIVELRAAKQRLEQQRASEFERIEQIGRALASNLQREQIVELLQQALLTNDEYGCEAVALLTWNERGEFSSPFVRSRHYLAGNALSALCEQILELAVQAGAPEDSCRSFNINLLASEKFREQEALSQPLRGCDFQALPLEGKAMGVLAIFSVSADAFSAECHRVFHILARQAGTALDSIALFEQVRELARRDGLTQLYNHLYFMDLLENEARRSRRYHRAVSLLFLDVDHFKQVNDSLGHQTGDQILVQIARLIQDSVRDTDWVGRYGGEEFAALLPESTGQEALALAERLRAKVEEKTFEANDHRLRMTLSIGVASFLPEEVGAGEELLHKADEALLRAKSLGRNRVCAL